MGIVGLWTRTVAALALVTGATLATAAGLTAEAVPAAAGEAPSLGVSMGQVSLSATGTDFVSVAIQLNGSVAMYSAAIHVGTSGKYDPAPLATLNDVVKGVSNTTVKISPDTFGPSGHVLVLTGGDGKVAGTADIGGWTWDGIGRWDIVGRS